MQFRAATPLSRTDPPHRCPRKRVKIIRDTEEPWKEVSGPILRQKIIRSRFMAFLPKTVVAE